MKIDDDHLIGFIFIYVLVISLAAGGVGMLTRQEYGMFTAAGALLVLGVGVLIHGRKP